MAPEIETATPDSSKESCNMGKNYKFNENEPWSHEDLHELYRLYQYGITLNRIGHFLGRSPSSCHAALRKVMVQQILHHTLDEVREHYDDERVPNLLASKYYVPLDKELSYAPATRTWNDTPWGIMVYFIFVLMVIGYGVVFPLPLEES